MLQLSSTPSTPAVDVEAPSASSLLGSKRHESETGRIYNEIFDAVMDRRLLPGTKLTEAKLCEIFSCSRTVIRAVLAELAHDKIVSLEANRGAFVWQPDPKETREVFELRRDMECLIIDKLLRFPDLEQRLQGLYEMVEREQSSYNAGQRISWIRLSNAFHVEMARLLGNDVLTELMHMLCARTSLIIAYHDKPGEQACSFFEHEQILNLLCQRNRDGALHAMQHHLLACEQRMNEEQAPAKQDPWQAFGAARL